MLTTSRPRVSISCLVQLVWYHEVVIEQPYLSVCVIMCRYNDGYTLQVLVVPKHTVIASHAHAHSGVKQLLYSVI